jgi:hypothetical protein
MAPPRNQRPHGRAPREAPAGGSAAVEEAGWKLLAGSVAGRSHLANDRGNEDAVRTTVQPDGTLLLALADGAGSAPRAGDGAWRSVDTAAMALAAFVGQAASEAGLRHALRQVRHEVAALACELGARPRDFACTLLLAVISADTLAVLQVGDGAIVARSEGDWRRVTQPLRGRHAGETVFVTSRRATDVARVDKRPLARIDAIALLSDGLEPVATDVGSGDPHGPFFDPLAAFAARDRELAQQEAELEAFLASERVQSRCLDDLSLILAVRR